MAAHLYHRTHFQKGKKPNPDIDTSFQHQKVLLLKMSLIQFGPCGLWQHRPGVLMEVLETGESLWMERRRSYLLTGEHESIEPLKTKHRSRHHLWFLSRKLKRKVFPSWLLVYASIWSFDHGAGRVFQTITTVQWKTFLMFFEEWKVFFSTKDKANLLVAAFLSSFHYRFSYSMFHRVFC